ncbi:MAG TPA: hypothetical protein VIH86_03080 [Puia sp.]
MKINFGDVIYSERLIEKVNFENYKINVLDGAGVVISKLISSSNSKRPRDIYDIYLSLTESSTLGKMKHLVSINPTINDHLVTYASLVKENWTKYENSLIDFGIFDPDAKNKLLMGR